MEKMQMRLALGAEIRGEVAAQQLKLEDVAAHAGLDRVTLYRYIKGERAMPLDALLSLASALGISPASLVQRAEDRAHRDSQCDSDSE